MWQSWESQVGTPLMIVNQMSLRSTPLKTQPRLNISNFDLIKHFHFSIWRYNAIIAYSKIKHWQKQILWWKYTSENNVNGSDNEHWSCWEGIDHTGKAGLIWRFDIWKCCGISYSDNGLNSFLTMLVTFLRWWHISITNIN